ncbi:hypothetical protein NLG97_g10534 [Lecanicillium saksenae]|uniref:Uncharacterized protein n=1 Tax=Lecanicillium saksenae TaxID=468837 RepID=A0ACC1QEB5_9HYPO|nr:hypothetical protein NLG97_g10534 [Lecanicillium saksenae]
MTDYETVDKHWHTDTLVAPRLFLHLLVILLSLGPPDRRSQMVARSFAANPYYKRWTRCKYVVRHPRIPHSSCPPVASSQHHRPSSAPSSAVELDPAFDGLGRIATPAIEPGVF